MHQRKYEFFVKICKIYYNALKRNIQGEDVESI